MTRATPASRPWLTTPVLVLLATAAGFAIVAVVLTLRLRGDLRAQILQREAEAIASMVGLQERRAQVEFEATGLGAETSDWFPLLLETTRLRGVIGLRLFDAAGELRDAAPMPVSARLPSDDWPRLRGGAALARFYPHVDSASLRVGDPELLTEGGDPLLEVVAPLRHPLDREYVGAAQYWIEGGAMAAEFRRLDRSLWLRAGVAAGLGATFVIAALWWAFRRLRAAHRDLQARSDDLARANHEFSLAAKTSAVGAITAHLLHGLKNPLDGLEGYVSSQPSEDSRAAGEEWRAAMETTQRIRSLINEVLAILREEQAGGARYRISVAELVSIAEEKIRPFAQSCGVSFAARRDDDAELPGRRAHLVLLVLDNLLRNACEATPHGGRVTLAATRLGGDVIFTVDDTGPGLSAAVRERVFQPVTSTKPGGGGIGLVLSHQLAQHAGGYLTLDKSDPRGCRFRLAVPTSTPVFTE